MPENHTSPTLAVIQDMAAAYTGLVFGPVKIGYSLATFLFGFGTAQTYIYYRDFADDPLPIKLLVAVVWAADFAHQISLGHCTYWYLVRFFGVPAGLFNKAPQSVTAIIESSTILLFLVPAFFTYRFWRSSKKHIQVGLLAVLIAARLVMTSLLGGLISRAPSYVISLLRFRSIILFCWICGAAVDVLLTIALCYDLHVRQRSTMYYRTARMIDRLKMWCVATGMATSIVAAVMAVCFCIMDNNIWMGIYFVLPRLVSNSLLASLNLRRSLRQMDPTGTGDLALQPRHPPPGQHANGISICVDVVTEMPVKVMPYTSS
ncbi:hypothetical protein Hypma_004739 [Hypsizygus marmoreus]|uniref:DUF6534 domain-containing protein n=1 Tax=Hypsizygus marmoreus TaxID=39966 RepID=A0A369J1N9_HYPMA|nr:hypothetical protein Hypma_004739 [Hypsizygus marmoreus]